MALGRCPRCEGVFAEEPAGTQGAYRSATNVRSCDHCSVAIRTSSDFLARGRLRRSAAVKSAHALHDRCPDCRCRLVRLVMAWGEAPHVCIEECGYCGVVVVDHAEHARLSAIVRACAPLDEEAVAALVERAPEVEDHPFALWRCLRWIARLCWAG